MDAFKEEEEEETGTPGWMATFADLMSLLMCFFVLLLSFSEMDVLKFKQIAGSMKFAFGVQNKIEVKDIEASAIKRLRKEPDELEQLEETEEETNDDFENLYKGQISKSGVAILPSKRTRRIPEVKKPSLADEALNELKAEQPEIQEENLETEEAPLELNDEAPAQEAPAQEESKSE